MSTIFRPYLRLGFKSYVEEPAISEQIYDTTPSSGITYHVTDGLRLFVNHDLVAPLLRDDLSDAERLGLQWFVANTLVHEIMVNLFISSSPNISDIELACSWVCLDNVGFLWESPELRSHRLLFSK